MKVLCVVGARPNFVKIAPLAREMRRYPQLAVTLVHTGQHYDARMSDQFFADLEIPAPDVNLGVGSGSHGMQTAEVMRKLEPLLQTARPDLVLVVGDVNSTLAAAITAVKLAIPVAHVEAGLRSFDRTMPEEVNRVLTDAISDYLFVTEESGCDNLLHEGIPPARIHFVGNVMIDALHLSRPRWERSTIVERLGLRADRPYAVVTLHRPSNVDDPARLSQLLAALRQLSRELPVVFPVHPRVRPRISDEDGGDGGVLWVDPLGYLDFVALVNRARLVLTDSGGIQEETTMLNVPCLTLRDTTERPVTVTHGTNRVIGTDPARILGAALEALAEPPQRRDPPPRWDGQAASRIVKVLVEAGFGERPPLADSAPGAAAREVASAWSR